MKPKPSKPKLTAGQVMKDNRLLCQSKSDWLQQSLKARCFRLPTAAIQ